MSQKNSKTAFVRHENPDQFFLDERKRRGWVPHTVGLLVLSPKGDQLGMALPGTARRNDADHIRTPPQLRMSLQTIATVYPQATEEHANSVQRTALIAAHEFLTTRKLRQQNDQAFFGAGGDQALTRNRLVYLGSTRGNDNRDGYVVKHGKYFHWVAMRLDEYSGVFRDESVVYQGSQWVNAARLASLPEAMLISARKFKMVDQALLEYYRITGDYNKLVRFANERQMAAAA